MLFFEWRLVACRGKKLEGRMVGQNCRLRREILALVGKSESAIGVHEKIRDWADSNRNLCVFNQTLVVAQRLRLGRSSQFCMEWKNLGAKCGMGLWNKIQKPEYKREINLARKPQLQSQANKSKVTLIPEIEKKVLVSSVR